MAHYLCLAILGCFQGAEVSIPPERLYYLNSPESIKSSGIVADVFTPNTRQKTRAFFHFVNKTKSKKKFVIRFDKSIQQFKSGYGISTIPGDAGRQGVSNFMSSKGIDKTNGCTIEVALGSGETISGLCEGITNEKTNIKAYLGSESKLLENKVKETSNVTEIKNSNPSVSFVDIIRIGTKRNGTIDGDYGTTFKFKICPDITKPSKLKIFVSPRGGRVSLCFMSNGVKKETSSIAATRNFLIYEIDIMPKSSFEFETILPGGYSYPLEFRISLS